MINNKNEALKVIRYLSNKFNIKLNEVTSVLTDPNYLIANKAKLTKKLLSFMSFILIFIGLGLYISSMWHHLNFSAKLIITLGPGISAFVVGLICIDNNKYLYYSTPFLIIGSFFESLGIFAILSYLSPDPFLFPLYLALIIIILFIQYLITFSKFKTNTNLFLTILLGNLIISALNIYVCFIIGLPISLFGIIPSCLLLFISYKLIETNYKKLCPVLNFFGSIGVLLSYFALTQGTFFEFSFFFLATLGVCLGIYLYNRVLLFTSTFFLAYFLLFVSTTYFSNSSLWYFILIILGVICFGAGGNLNRIYQEIKKS